MRLINKRDRRYRKLAHHIVNRFLFSAWNKDLKCYIGCDFDNFKRNKRFKSLLFREQDGYCCYCMRKLDLEEKGKSTIEHVMPHMVEDDDVAFYFAQTPHLKKHVRRFLIDGETEHLLHFHPYPHFCAYENLVLSCSGSIYKTDNPEKEISLNLHECCNNPRGNQRVLPMFFFRNSNIEYDIDGTMIFPPIFESSIKALRLELTDNLCLIRKAWASIVKYHSIKEVENALSNQSLRKDILMDTTLTVSEVKRISHDLYWKVLFEYRWFGDYYGKKNNMK